MSNNTPTDTSWKPGQSGNPNGRPHKEETITEAVKQWLRKDKNKEKFIQKIGEMALSGDKNAMRLIWNYIDGMPLQKQEIKAELDNVNINFGKIDDNKS